MALIKPDSVASSSKRSAKWDELVTGRSFTQADAPILALLCQWYEVLDKCMEDIDIGGGIQVAYQNDMGDIKALPQLATMKQASAEIRALNKQLGISDEAHDKPQRKEAKLHVIQANRMSRAKNTPRTA